MGVVEGLSPTLLAVVALAAVLVAAVLGAALVRSRRGAGSSARSETLRAEGAERRLAGLLASIRDGVVLHAPSGRVLRVSPPAATMLGADAGELIGKDVARLPVRWLGDGEQPVAPGAVFAHRSAHDETGAPVAPFVVGLRPDGGSTTRWVQVSTQVVPAADGGHELLTVLADVTGPREIRAALARSETQFRAAMENAPIGMVLLDPQWRLEQVNAAFARLLGVEPESLLGRDLSALSHPQDRAKERAGVQRLLAGESERFTVEKRYLRSDGQMVWAVLDVALVRTPQGLPDHFVAQVSDITESRMQSEALAHRAAHDPLTGLGNRSVMQEALQSALEQHGAAGRVAVLVIDLDEFKQINDRYGHPAGDDVLVHVAGVLRAATAGRGTVSRLGGDEFVIVVQDPDAARVVFDVAGGIHAGLSQPVRAQRRRLIVRASVGIAVADQSLVAGGAMALLAAADTALYQAKAGGRSRTEVYDGSMVAQVGSKHGAAAELGDAIARGQLVLHYQPVVDLATGQVVGHEALVRWQHPERGLLLPGVFLPTAQEAGLGVALGSAVVSQAVTHLARSATGWVSVNVSGDQLADGGFGTRLLAELQRTGVSADRLVIELTESSLVDSGTRVRHELTELSAFGVPVILDDFGTGTSPLSHLRDLPVDGVKLDMSFAAGIPEDPAAARVSRALGALARELGLTTIAAGIETREQGEFMRGCGWRYGQGWLFGVGQSDAVAAEVVRPLADPVAEAGELSS